LGDAERFDRSVGPFHPGSQALGAHVGLAQEGSLDDPHRGASLLDECDRHRDDGEPVQEVGGAVEGSTSQYRSDVGPPRSSPTSGMSGVASDRKLAIARSLAPSTAVT
jgi:hypothetical protein